jgi:mono/diheme cytochrome c family protein
MTLLFLLVIGSAQGAGPEYPAVAAVLARHCVVCHSGDGAPLALRLDSYDAILTGSSRGPIVQPGAPEASELIRRLRGTSQPRMPLTGPPFLPDSQVMMVAAWIAAGAPRGAEAAPSAVRRTLPAPGSRVTFADVRPILLQSCVKCHGESSILGAAPEGLRLQELAQVLRNDRVVVVPGHPLASELWRRVAGHARPRMPFDGPPYLSEDQIRVIRDWISQGARDDSGRPASPVAGGRVRLHGLVDTDGGLDGLPLILSPRARVSPLRAGAYVEVRGVIDSAGRVVVERLRER